MGYLEVLEEKTEKKEKKHAESEEEGGEEETRIHNTIQRKERTSRNTTGLHTEQMLLEH